MRWSLRLAALTAVVAPAAAGAAALAITKTATVISDGVNLLNPKMLPGAVVDYALTVDNPNSVINPVGAVVITDELPTGVVLRVDGYGAGTSPIEFADGNLLGTGLLGSGLSLTYRGLGDTTDGVQFYDGTTWNYTPVSTGGYDARVRAIRVTLSGTQVSGSRFRLRFRVKLQ
jgi:hypothetical protein